MDPAPMEAELELQRDALRIQVAAVAAQQAALLEEECRLQQQQEALTRQQEQLSAHLDEKRQRVLLLANQVQTARTALDRERQEQTEVWVRQSEALAQQKQQFEQEQSKLRGEQQRLLALRTRLKKHFQRLFAAERKQLRQREEAVHAQHLRIEGEAEKLQHEREDLVRARLSLNGDMELARRQMHTERQKFAAEQNLWLQERSRRDADFIARSVKLRQREESIASSEQQFAAEKHEWALKRSIAENELRGLNERIANQRQKLQEITPQTPARPAPLGTPATNVAAVLPTSKSIALQSPRTVAETAQHLDRLADDLAARRLELVEHWRSMLKCQFDWSTARNAAVDELTMLLTNLEDRDRALEARQTALDSHNAALRQRKQDLVRFRQQLEGWSAQLRLQEASWNGERNRLLAECRVKEETVSKRLEALTAVRQSWARRRRQEVEHLSTERAACAKWREQCAALREECWKRDLSLEQQQRELAEKTLALEEFREQLVLRSDDPASTESRLERLRKHWAQQNAAATRVSAEQFERLKQEAARLQQRGRDLLKIAEELTNREASLSQRQSAWEQTLAQSQADQVQTHQMLQIAEAQRHQCEQQIADLQGEIERLSRLLLDAPDDFAIITAQAA